MCTSYTGGPAITPQQAAAYAYAAGFRGDGLAHAVATALAETGGTLALGARNDCGNAAGTDRGILQFNSVYHGEVSDGCADDPACAFAAAYRVTQGGTRWSEWSTSAPGPNSYSGFLSRAEAAIAQIGSGGSGSSVSIPGGSSSGSVGSALGGGLGGTQAISTNTGGDTNATTLGWTDPLNALCNIPWVGSCWWKSAVQNAAGPLEHKGAQLGFIVIGGVAALIGVFVLISSSEQGQQVIAQTKTAAKAAAA